MSSWKSRWSNFVERLFQHPKTTLSGLAAALAGLAAVFGYTPDAQVVNAVVAVLAGIIGIFAKDN